MTAAPTSAALCCCACGQAAPPGELITKTVGAQTPSGQRLRDVVVTMTRCAGCQARHSLASDLVAAHPAMAARLGKHRAKDVAEGVLMAFAALDQAAPDLASASNADLALWIRHLGNAGLSLSFSGRLTGPGEPPAAYSWAHLDDSDRGRLRDGYAAALHEKVARNAAPVALRPPSGQPPMPGVNVQGCLFCGRDSVSMSAAEVTRLGGRQNAEREVWHSISSIDPASIGGRMSPTRLSGYLCPGCSDAVDSVGSIGQSALHRALLHHLDQADRPDDARRLRASDGVSLVAWAVTGQPANQKPWCHLILVP